MFNMPSVILPIVAEAAVSYGAQAIAGHAARNYLHNVKDGIAQAGANAGAAVAGNAGEYLGRAAGVIAGKAAAGSQIPLAKEGMNAIAGATATVGTMALDRYVGSQAASDPKKEDGKTPQRTWSATAGNVAAGTAVAAGCLAAAYAAPVAITAIAVAALASVPSVIKACTEEAKPADQKEGLVDGVVVPVAKEVVTQAAQSMVGNIVRFEVVEAAYRSRVNQFGAIGNAVGSYIPFLGRYCEQAGRIAGHVDAGRYAMSEPVLAIANTAGDVSSNVVGAAIQVVDKAIPEKKESGKTSWWNTARKAGWVAAGVLGGAALVSVAPEVAAVTGAVAAIHAVPRVISYCRSAAPAPGEAKPEQPKELEVAKAALKPEAEPQAETLGIAAEG